MTETKMGNRLCNVFFTPHILEQLFKHGTTRATPVEDAVPGSAQMRGAGYDPVRGAFYLTFEHETFKELSGGELLPEMRPLFRDDSPRPLTDVPEFDAWAMWQFKVDREDRRRVTFGHNKDTLDFIMLPAPIASFGTGPLGVLFQCADHGVYLLQSDSGDPNDKDRWRIRLLQYV